MEGLYLIIGLRAENIASMTPMVSKKLYPLFLPLEVSSSFLISNGINSIYVRLSLLATLKIN